MHAAMLGKSVGTFCGNSGGKSKGDEKNVEISRISIKMGRKLASQS